MKLDILTNEEFIKLAKHQTRFNSIIAREWLRRFDMSYPYNLNSSGEIYNNILNEPVEDDYSDRLIVEQAQSLRNEVDTQSMNK